MSRVLIICVFSVILLTVSIKSNYGSAFPIHSSRELSVYELEVIAYFKEIALGYEYGTASQITRKWRAPMKIFVDGSPDELVRREVQIVVEELNELATDGFYIQIVNEKSLSNFHLFVGSNQEYTSMYPQDVKLTPGNSATFTVTWNKRNEIIKGRIFVRNNTSIEEQRHAVREELTQSLGLGRDATTYPESIFQLKYTIPTKFADIDRELVRLLYHPKMVPGLSSSDVETVLAEIFLNEPEL